MFVEQFANELDAIADRFGNGALTKTLERCYDTIIEGERQMFADRSGPDGSPWPDRLETVENHPLLNRSGSLLAAATGGNGHVKRIGNRELITGVQKGSSGSLAGALVHQYGATIRPRSKPFLNFRLNGKWVQAKQVTIPARPYIGASAETTLKLYDDVSIGVLEEVFHRG